MAQRGSSQSSSSAADFGELLRVRRRELGLTQRQLGQLVACAEITLRKIEAHQRGPSPQLAQLLAEALKLGGADRERFISAALMQPLRNAGLAPQVDAQPNADADQLNAADVEALATATFVTYNDETSRAQSSRLFAGIDTVRAELRWRLQENPRAALRLSGLLLELWLRHNLIAEGRGWCEHALLHDAAPTADRALALLVAAVMAGNQNDFTHASLRADECAAIKLGDVTGAFALIRPRLLHLRGWLAMRAEPNRTKALDWLEQARMAFEDAGHPLRAVHTRCDIAMTHAYCGGRPDVAASLAQATQALDEYRAANSAFGEALALGALAEANLAEDTAEGAMRAEPFARQSLAAWRAMNHAYNVAWSAARLSEICRLQNKLEEAKSYTDEALPLFQAMGDRQAVCFRLQGLAQIARARGDITEARRRIAASLTLAHDLHSRPAVLRAFSELIAMALAEHDHAHASVLLGAIDARRAFLSDALSRMVCDDLERQVIEACAQTNVDSASNRAHGAAMSVRELTMIIIDKG